MAKIKAVVFDMDGVLVEAKDWHYEALNRALGLFGYTVTRYDHLVTFDGLPTRKKLEMLSRERGLPTGLHPIISNLKQKYTTELTHQRCRPTFAHEYALAALKAKGYRLAVASNSIRSTIELMMSKTCLDQYLDLVLSNQDVTAPKPSPEIYLAALKELNILPQECLVLEDNENGIRSAKAAGTHLMTVGNVDEVTLDNIEASIRRAEKA